MLDLDQILQLLTPNETALEFLSRKQHKPLYTGIDPLDQCSFRGSTGVQPGDIIEIYGNSGCGASQLCLTALLNCIMPLIPASSSIIDHHKNTKSQKKKNRRRSKKNKNCEVEVEEEQDNDDFEQVDEDEEYKSVFRTHDDSSSNQHTVLFFDMDFKFDEIQLVKMLEERINVILMTQIQEKRTRMAMNHPELNIEVDQVVSQEEYDQHFMTIFQNDENFSKFVHDTIARVKIVRPQSAFAFWTTIESLISVEKERRASCFVNLSTSNATNTSSLSQVKSSSPYGCIIVDSLTCTFSHKFSSQKRDWERACEALVRLTKLYECPLFATVREMFPRESRKAYRQEALAQSERTRRYLSDEQRILEQMYIIHREVMCHAWRNAIKYRLLIDTDERTTHNGKFLAALCPIVSEHGSQQSRPIRPSKLYQFQIASHGVVFDQEDYVS